MRHLLTELYARNPVLAVTGWIHVGLCTGARPAAAPRAADESHTSSSNLS